jgi:hypothetical protein
MCRWFWCPTPAGVFHSYRDIHGRYVDELSLVDLLARLDSIIEMEADGIPDIV